MVIIKGEGSDYIITLFRKGINIINPKGSPKNVGNKQPAKEGQEEGDCC